MKKLELSKDQMASIIGGRKERTQGEKDCIRYTDKVDKCGRLTKFKTREADPITFNGDSGVTGEGSAFVTVSGNSAMASF